MRLFVFNCSYSSNHLFYVIFRSETEVDKLLKQFRNYTVPPDLVCLPRFAAFTAQ